MDYHALQQKLFELDPTDPKEDLARLQAQASGGSVSDVAPTKDYVAESVEVPQGSMPLGLDSISDFAALAGVRIDEKQKMGSAGQAKGKDPMPKVSKPSTTGEQPHPLKDKLVGESSEDRIAALEARVAQLEEMLEAKMKVPSLKPRDPSSQYMNDLRKSGAMGAHKDKKKDFKAGKEKHKGKEYEAESIKDRLFAELAKYELKR